MATPTWPATEGDSYYDNAISLKRGWLNIDEGVQNGNELVDEDYGKFLNMIGECCEDDFVEEDDIDPHYKIFLENLREYGHSYSVEVYFNDQTSVCMKYEGDDGSSLEPQPHTLRNLDKVSRSGRKKLPTSRNDHLSSNPSKNLENCSREIEKDLEVNKRPEFVGGRQILTSHKRKRPLNPSKDLDKSSREIKKDLELNKQLGFVGRGKMMNRRKINRPLHPSKNLGNCSRKIEKDMEQIKHPAHIDESYRAFLHCLRQDGNNMTVVTEKGRRWNYEENDENSSDSDVIANDSAPHCSVDNSTPFVTSKVYDSSMNKQDNFATQLIKTEKSKFREKLMDILRKPYDEEEYGKLLHDASIRKPKLGNRELRGRFAKSYELDSLAESYLQQHKDLKKKIDRFQSDRRIVLNLLRGFFFWLENLAHEGAFKPWSDKACLEVISEVLDK